MVNTIIKGLVFHVVKVNFTNKDTGEVNSYCRVDYLVKEEPTDNSVGMCALDCYCKYDDFGVLCDYIGKLVDLELTPKLVNAEINGSVKKVARFNISKINGKSLA